MRAPTRLCTTGASRSITAPGQTPSSNAQRREDEHGGEREAVGLMRGFGGGRARPAEEGDAVGLDEAGGRQRRRQRQQRADRRDQEAQPPLRQIAG